MSRRLVVIGDALLDRDLDGRAERLCPDAPAPVVDDITARERPGGAGLAALLAARDGLHVTLVTALGDDDAGRALARALAGHGVVVSDVGLDGATPEKVRVRAGGQVIARLDHGGPPGTPGELTAAASRAIGAADAVLVSDYGRGISAERTVRAALEECAAPVVWDPHPRGAAPVPGAALITPNAAEARALAPGADAVARARRLGDRVRARAVAVTLGADGAVLVERGRPPLTVPAPRVAAGDPCGAGDRLASAAAGALAAGGDIADAVRAGVDAASAFVAAGGAAGAARPGAGGAGDAADPVARVRAAGGTVVATGGCFDLLHAGHVSMLESARALGDCLVVLLNSDDSVRRLKGADRPLVPEGDRARVLSALRCVDAVRVFGEDTPERALADLRPHIWAKGADYDPERLPEAATVRRAGGRVVGLPFVAGRSTTRLIQEAAERVAL